MAVAYETDRYIAQAPRAPYHQVSVFHVIYMYISVILILLYVSNGEWFLTVVLDVGSQTGGNLGISVA